LVPEEEDFDEQYSADATDEEDEGDDTPDDE
jgi:hypothetical protein